MEFKNTNRVGLHLGSVICVRGFLAVAALLLMLTACSQDPEGTKSSDSTNSNSELTAKFLLATEPENALGVVKVRNESKDADEVVVVGRIGGSANPWVDGQAAFSIVDLSLKSCAENGSDGCPKPWDYC